MSRRADSLTGTGRGVAKASPPTPEPAIAGIKVAVEFSEDWAGLTAAIQRGAVRSWRPLREARGGLWGTAGTDLLLRVTEGGALAGFFLAHHCSSGAYELLPLLKSHGADAIAAGQLCLRKLFMEGPATLVFLRVPDDVAGASEFATGCGFHPAGKQGGVSVVRLDFLSWIEQHRAEFRATGEQFHRLLFADQPAPRAEDALRDEVVGICLAVARFQPAKARVAYDGMALLFGLDDLEPLVTTAAVVVFALHGATLCLNRITGNLSVLHRA